MESGINEMEKNLGNEKFSFGPVIRPAHYGPWPFLVINLRCRVEPRDAGAT